MFGRRGEPSRQPEGAPQAGQAVHPDRAAHQLGQLFADRRPQLRASLFPRRGAVRLGEDLEQPSLLLGDQADPAAGDRETQNDER